MVVALLLAGCSDPAKEAPDRAYPPELTQWGYAPVETHFGYDPDGADAVYGHELVFDNLDPNSFSDTPEGDASRRAIGWLTTHPVLGDEMPMWMRVAAEPTVGPVEDRLTRFGFLPSPFRPQFAAKVPFPAADGGDPVDVDISVSLAEPITTFDEGTDGRRAYLGMSCMLCHGGVYGDHVIAGAPNKQYNTEQVMQLFGTFGQVNGVIQASPDKAEDVVNTGFAHALESRGDPTPRRISVAPAELQILDFVAKLGTDVWRPIFSAETNATVGPNASTWGGPYAQMCSLVPNGKNLDDWDIDPVTGPAPLMQRMLAEVAAWGPLPIANARPWWLARYTGSHFLFYISRHGVEYSAPDLAMATSSPPNYGNPHIPKFDERYKRSVDLQTYMDQLKSPPFPGDIDWDRADAGMTVYADTCARCHGALSADGAVGPDTRFTLTFDETASRVPSSESGTDTAYSEFAKKVSFCNDNFESNGQYPEYPFGNHVPHPGDEPFIAAPPLIGVWASAPYLHNASVPTVAQVLDSASRPAVWRLDADPYAYDFDDVGVVHEVLASAPTAPKKDPLDWYVYDTSLPGMSNRGHPFGDALSSEQRGDVIELLKALGTENVTPNPVNIAWDQ
jgi:hypothetical protein